MFPFTARLFCTLALLITPITLNTPAQSAGVNDGKYFAEDTNSRNTFWTISLEVTNNILSGKITATKRPKKYSIKCQAATLDADGNFKTRCKWSGQYTYFSNFTGNLISAQFFNIGSFGKANFHFIKESERSKYEAFSEQSGIHKTSAYLEATNNIQVTTTISATPNTPTVVKTDTISPVIVIKNDWETSSSVVRLKGRIEDTSKIMELTINGLPTQVDEDGNFTANRGAMAGTNQIVLLATDVWGNQSEKTISVTRKVMLSTVEANDNNATADDLSNLLYGNYYALVIGNNDYEGLPKLATAVADARSVAEVLHRNYRYDVELLLNATRRDVFKAFANLNRKLKANDNLLVYYAGHGYLDAELDKGYWLPVDADRDFKSDWISNADITDAIRVINSNHIMIVADSCFSGSLVRNVNMNTASNQNRKALLERLIGKKSRTVMTSGGLEPVADGGGDGHSVFARAFLDVLIENDTVIEGQEFFTRIRNKVIVNANQTPEYSDVRMSGHDGGDFIFVRRNP